MDVLRLISQLIGIETLKLTIGIIIKILFGDRELVLFFYFIFFLKFIWFFRYNTLNLPIKIKHK